MAWDFDGVNQYVRFTMNATLQAAPGGPMSMACVIHFDSTTDGAVIHMLTSAQASRPWIEMFGNWNYGTTAGARSGPAGVTGAWYLAIFSKNTGNIAPEYTIIPLATGGTGTSGTLTGGGATLGDGTAAGAGGIIQVARWGTSATEYIDGRIAAAAIWNVYLNQAAREALTTWALWLASTGIQWAVRFNTLSTLTDATLLGGDETGRFGTATQTMSADPGALAIDFFATGGGTSVQDTSGGSGTGGTDDGRALGDSSSGGGTGGTEDGRALGAGSGGSGTGGSDDGRALGSGSDGGGTSGSGDGRALGAGSDGGGTGGTSDGLAVGDYSGGGGSAGSPDTIVTGAAPVVIQDTSGGGGTGGAPDGRALGDSSGGGGSAGSSDGRTLGAGSGGAGTGGSPDTITVPGVPVTISDTSGGSGTGGSTDTAATDEVVHDTMVMPLLVKAHECLITEVGKVSSPPNSVQIRPGATFTPMADATYDECCNGIAWVRPGQQVPTGGNWPVPLTDVSGPSRGEAVYYAVQIELGIIRCIPTVSDVEGTDNAMPTAAQWLKATQDAMDDAAALRRTICCLQAIYGTDAVLAGPIVPLQNEGNCGGQVVVIQVRAPACDCVG